MFMSILLFSAQSHSWSRKVHIFNWEVSRKQALLQCDSMGGRFPLPTSSKVKLKKIHNSLSLSLSLCLSLSLSLCLSFFLSLFLSLCYSGFFLLRFLFCLSLSVCLSLSLYLSLYLSLSFSVF